MELFPEIVLHCISNSNKAKFISLYLNLDQKAFTKENSITIFPKLFFFIFIISYFQLHIKLMNESRYQSLNSPSTDGIW